MNPHYGVPQHPRLSHFIVALLGAVLGVMLTLAVAPYVMPYVFSSMPIESPPPEVQTPLPSEEIPPDGPAGDLEESIKTVVRSVGPSVVAVINRRAVTDIWGRTYSRDGQGSGVVIDAEGHVVTNYHVIEDANQVLVEDSEGREYEAVIVGTDPSTDLAVLMINDSELDPVPFGDSDGIEIGQLAIAIGNPLGREFARSVTLGVVSGVRSTMYGQGTRQRVFELIQTDASINPGNSGGALLDSRGRLIGINTLKFAAAEVEGMGFAIPSNTVRRIAGEIIEHGEVRRAWMGMTGMSVEDARREGEDIDLDSGVFVSNVLADSPAGRAGLRSEDIIIRMNETRIDNIVDLLKFLEGSMPGDDVTMEVVRDGEHLVIEFELGTVTG
ncbi:MAG: trypsin-like peptidase domain-containing protein [Bacillota bacterium]